MSNLNDNSYPNWALYAYGIYKFSNVLFNPYVNTRTENIPQNFVSGKNWGSIRSGHFEIDILSNSLLLKSSAPHS